MQQIHITTNFRLVHVRNSSHAYLSRESAGVPASAVGPSGFGPAGSPTRSSTPGAAIPSRGSRSGGGGGFRSWPGARRRFGRVGGPARLRPFRRGAPLSPCAGAAVRSLAAGAAKPVFPPAPKAVVERSGCWFVRPPERRRGSLPWGRRSERGRRRIARFDAAARGTGDSHPRAFRVAEPATAREASGRALPGHGVAGILPLHPTPHSLSRPASSDAGHGIPRWRREPGDRWFYRRGTSTV